MMKKVEMVENALVYEAPQVDVIEVEVEKGFATSPNDGTTIPGQTIG